MKIHRIIWERFDVNSYVLEYDEKAVIIDCNSCTYPYLETNNIKLDYVFLTHEHFDHIEGLGQIKAKFPEVKTIATKTASQLFSSITDNMSKYFDGQDVVENSADIEITENTVFNIFNKEFKCFLTPGHTKGCMVIQVDNFLFTGDTVLNNIKTPKQGPNASKAKLIESLDFIESYFPDNILIYPGHGNSLYKYDWHKSLSLGKI